MIQYGSNVNVIMKIFNINVISDNVPAMCQYYRNINAIIINNDNRIQ